MISDNALIAHTARTHIVFTMAEDSLLSKGEANPGGIIRSLSWGLLLGRTAELAQAAREHAWLFMNDDYDRGVLYELTLNQLEQKHGPLFCVPDDEVCGAHADTWGYADIYSDSSVRTTNLAPVDVPEFWARRIAALMAGHPDHCWYYDVKETPQNIWRRGTVPAKADASQSDS